MKKYKCVICEKDLVNYNPDEDLVYHGKKPICEDCFFTVYDICDSCGGVYDIGTVCVNRKCKIVIARRKKATGKFRDRFAMIMIKEHNLPENTPKEYYAKCKGE